MTSKLTEHGLTLEEDMKCNAAFAAFDKDDSGFIDGQELAVVLEMMGQEKSENFIYGMMAEVTGDNVNNTISLDDFKRVIGE